MAAKTGGVTAGTAYSTSKGALQSLTFSLARETCRQGITVNGIAPAYVRTPMVRYIGKVGWLAFAFSSDIGDQRLETGH